MEGEEFDALVADIRANRLRGKIVLYKGKILDGRNRYRALRALGACPEEIRDLCCATLDCIDEHPGGPVAYVMSANIHRRHLTPAQKRELIAKLIKAQPEKSDRQIAAAAKASPTTVGTVRAKLGSTVQPGQLAKRVGKDGKARKLPVKKACKQPANKKTPQQTAIELFDAVGALAKREVELGFLTAEQIQAAVLPEHGATVVEKLRAAEIKIAGLESEVEELKAENTKLREQLEAAQKVAA